MRRKEKERGERRIDFSFISSRYGLQYPHDSLTWCWISGKRN
jgi:hypothetical protein